MSCSLQLGERASNVGLQPELVDGDEIEAGVSLADIGMEVLGDWRMWVGSSVGD